MKKLLLQIAISFGLNLVIYVLAMIAFGFFLFKDDPVLAAIPGVFVLVGIVFQPWFAVFALLAEGHCLGHTPFRAFRRTDFNHGGHGACL